MKVILLTAISMLLCFGAYAQEREDGTYDATVSTNSGTYTVPVEVQDGEVTTVYWPNGGNMSVDGASLDGIEASGYNSRGDNIDIQIDE